MYKYFVCWLYLITYSYICLGPANMCVVYKHKYSIFLNEENI